MDKVQLTINEQVKRYMPIYFYRRHLDLAAKDILGLSLSPHHRLVIRDWGRNKPINTFFASRGMGKSVLLAIFYLLMCILYPKLKVMIVCGNGYRGAKMVMLECERIILCQLSGQDNVFFAKNSLRIPAKPLSKDISYWTMTFQNGSIIYAVPLGLTNNGNVIRGLRAHILGQDESFMVPSKLYQAVLEPMLNVQYDMYKSPEEQMLKNMSIMISTCDFSYRDFYKQFEYYKTVLERKSNSNTIKAKDISLFEFNIDDSYYVQDTKRKMTWGIDYDKIVQKKELPTSDLSLWMSENKNIPLNLKGGYFDYESIEKCMNVCLDEAKDLYPEVLDSCSAPCILGIDTAPADANTAFVIIKAGTLDWRNKDSSLCQTANNGMPCPLYTTRGYGCKAKKKNALIYAYEENKMRQKNRVEKIYELIDRYNIISIALDARGGGYELADLLRDTGYVHTVIGPHAKAIYDPNNNPHSEGMPMLKLYALTQDMNMIMAAYLKGLVSNQYILLPRPFRDRPDNPRILEAMGHVEHAINQLARIKAYPAGRGLKFNIDTIDPNTGRTVSAKKDLFSAFLYSVGRLRELVDEQERLNRRGSVELQPAMSFNI